MMGDWEVDLEKKVATNGPFTVTYLETTDGGFSLNVVGGAQDLREGERFNLLLDAMKVIGERKFGR